MIYSSANKQHKGKYRYIPDSIGLSRGPKIEFILISAAL